MALKENSPGGCCCDDECVSIEAPREYTDLEDFLILAGTFAIGPEGAGGSVARFASTGIVELAPGRHAPLLPDDLSTVHRLALTLITGEGTVAKIHLGHNGTSSYWVRVSHTHTEIRLAIGRDATDLVDRVTEYGTFGFGAALRLTASISRHDVVVVLECVVSGVVVGITFASPYMSLRYDIPTAVLPDIGTKARVECVSTPLGIEGSVFGITWQPRVNDPLEPVVPALLVPFRHDRKIPTRYRVAKNGATLFDVYLFSSRNFDNGLRTARYRSLASIHELLRFEYSLDDPLRAVFVLGLSQNQIITGTATPSDACGLVGGEATLSSANPTGDQYTFAPIY